MTVLATVLETNAAKARKAGAFLASTICPSGRCAAIGGLGLAVAAPLLLPIAFLASAIAAAGRSVEAWLERGKRPPGVGGGGAIAALRRVGLGLPPKILQKIFGALPRWRRF